MTKELKLTLRTWIIIAAIAALMLGWVVAAVVLIGDRPPPWNYGATAPAPGDSYYTAGRAATAPPAPEQVTLPPQAKETAP
jgi:hypothetical protein